MKKSFSPLPKSSHRLSDKRIEQGAEDGRTEDDVGGSDFESADEKAG